MRIAVATLGLATGCRSVFGFEDPTRVADAAPIDNVIDVPVDGVAPIDAAAITCDASYAIITGGQAGHRYRFVGVPTEWSSMHADCVGTSGYLAIPNDAGELTAIFTLGGGGGSIWIGVTDSVAEAAFVDVLGATYTALAINNNGQGRDCAIAEDSVAPLDIENCGNNRPGVCECEE